MVVRGVLGLVSTVRGSDFDGHFDAEPRERKDGSPGDEVGSNWRSEYALAIVCQRLSKR